MYFLLPKTFKNSNFFDFWRPRPEIKHLALLIHAPWQYKIYKPLLNKIGWETNMLIHIYGQKTWKIGCISIFYGLLTPHKKSIYLGLEVTISLLIHAFCALFEVNRLRKNSVTYRRKYWYGQVHSLTKLGWWKRECIYKFVCRRSSLILNFFKIYSPVQIDWKSCKIVEMSPTSGRAGTVFPIRCSALLCPVETQSRFLPPFAWTPGLLGNWFEQLTLSSRSTVGQEERRHDKVSWCTPIT